MSCNKPIIKIFRGDDTDWDNRNFLRFHVSSGSVDLSTMTADFILAGISKNDISLADGGNFVINFSHEETASLPYGQISGVLRLTDSQNRIKTISVDMPFLVTGLPVGEQVLDIDLEIPQSDDISVNVQVGSEYATVEQLQAETAARELADQNIVASLQGKQDVSNLVTQISDTSTDTQYPSAKCVYDIVGDIEALLSEV